MRLAVLPVSSSFYCLGSSVVGDSWTIRRRPLLSALPAILTPGRCHNQRIEDSESLGLNITTFR
jgi:hypothetical protein